MRGEPDQPEPRGATSSSKLACGLYLVATPIGNLGDIGARAIAVLGAVDAVLCEDTRHSGRLMAALGLKVRLKPYHEHNAARVRPGLLDELARGARHGAHQRCRDAGDRRSRAQAGQGCHRRRRPGDRRARPVRRADGARISGLPTDRFFFQGFLPAKASARRKALAELAPIPATLVLFESPHRLAPCLADAATTLGPRPAAIARELTKLHEEVRRGSLEELALALATEPTPKGEIVLVIGPPGEAPAAVDDATLDQLLAAALAEHGPSRAAALVAEQTGQPRAAVYKRAIAQRGQSSDRG
jgi:16S rRNA (cytidine1402-2'-O)-methyltransferase